MRYTRELRFALVLAIGVAAGDTPGGLLSAVSAKLELRTIAELEFDKEIEDVAFGSYMVGDREWYYPKVVVRRQGPVVPKWQQREVELSVEILDSTGRVFNRIPHLKYFSRVWLSNSGNFIGVEEVPGQVGEDYPGRRPAPVRFTMYNDKGEMLWRRQGPEYDLSWGTVVVNPRNGSVFASFTGDSPGKSQFYYFDSVGTPRPLGEGRVSTSGWVAASAAGEFAVTVWAESTTGNWQEAVALFNGGGGLEWERWSYLRSSALAMSPYGDYISFSSVDDYYPDLTKAESPKEGAMEQKPAPKGALPKARAMKKIPVPPDSCVSACCLLNRRGELVMKLSVPFVVDECVFSPDGQRLAFCCRDSRARAKPRQDGIVVVNIPTREELFRAALPRGEKEREVLLADDAAAVILTDKKLYWITAAGSILGNVDVSSGLPREEDKEGMHSLLQSIRFLGWSGDAPVLGSIQHLAGKVRVFTVERR